MDDERCKWCLRVGPNPCSSIAEQVNCERPEAQRMDGWWNYQTRKESQEKDDG